MVAWIGLWACDGTSEPPPEHTAEPTPIEDRDGDGHAADVDCDDADNTVFPGAPERCDGVDQDCDLAIDEGFDLDGDDVLTALDAGCAALGPTDCDDTDATVHPGAVEVCDGRDDDCDGVIDPTTDADGDGVTVCDDCDDADDGVSPAALELCDGRDDDCDGISDEGFDVDGDGVGACLDCDEADPAVHPGAAEVCDAKDNDCDFAWDEGFDTDADGFFACRGDCDDTDPDVHLWAAETCDGADDDCNGRVDDVGDQDGDGWSACALVDPDCDDADDAVHPGAGEVCDGKDTDCDGVLTADEADADGDGEPVCAGDCDDADPDRASDQLERCDGVDNDCDAASDEAVDEDGDQLSACQGDCDDTRAAVRPGAPERCNAWDDDCDGALDDQGACSPCDVVSHDGHTYQFCTSGSGWAAADSDCRSTGYRLITIEDQLENQWVVDQAGARANRSWYGGYNDRGTEGVWVWTSGSSSSYASWALGEPNDSGGQDCMVFHYSGYDWDDQGCTTNLPYVCEVSR